MAAGLIDADLGGGLVKKRVRLPGRGKRGGARTIVATNRGDRWFFLPGFARNDRENIDEEDRPSLLRQAVKLLALGTSEIERDIQRGEMDAGFADWGAVTGSSLNASLSY